MALIVRHLSKHYGVQRALCGVDLTLSEGVVALLGANGSGKSTLLRVLATLCKPDRGEMAFNGHDYGRDQNNLRTQIGYLPQEFEIPTNLTPRRLLHYLAQLRGGEMRPVMVALGLESFADQPFHKLSGGQTRLVGIAQALLGQPRLLLLDELSRGLDVVERERVHRLLANTSGLTIFSTHIPEEVERSAQQVIVLHEGHLIFCGTLDALTTSAVGKVSELTLSTELLPQFMADKSISRIVPQGSHTRVRVIGEPSSDGAELVPPSVEDAYLLLKQKFIQQRAKP